MSAYSRKYGNMHMNPKLFLGTSIMAHVGRIGELINEIRFSYEPDEKVKLVDYGCGKGIQYSEQRIHDLYWAVDKPFLYDIGVPAYTTHPPKHSFHGVICTDLMEHITENDVDGVFHNIFDCLDPNAPKTFAFFSICCRPAKKTFPNGKNVHVTIQPPEWWHNRISHWKINNGRVIVHYT